MECGLVIYIQPGTVGYGLTTYILLRDEFCNTESSYNDILSGLCVSNSKVEPIFQKTSSDKLIPSLILVTVLV